MGTVTFTVRDQAGHETTHEVQVTVQEPLAPVSAFTLTADTGTAPLTLVAHQTCANADWFQFDWKGGTTQGIVHPLSDNDIQHIYDQPGSYQVSLRAWRDSDGAEAFSYHTVNVTPSPTTGKLGITFGGISEPLERVQGGISSADLDRWADEAKALGVGWLRGDYPVRQVSPSRGTYNYADTDRWVTRCVARGLKPLPIVYMLPNWMNNSSNDKAPPTNAQDYADWCGHVAPHWEDIGVTHVEIWNEQNLSGFWPAPDRVRYVDVFKRAADAIHAASNIKVLIGGVSTADTQYQAGNRGVPGYTSPELGCYCSIDCYGYLGAFSHADGVGIHPYLDGYRPCEGTDPAWCRWDNEAIARAIAICDRWGGQHLTVWNTESAAPRTAMTEAEQAVRSGGAFDAFEGCLKPLRSRLGPYFWFTLRDRGTDSGQRDNTFGLMTTTWGHHQAYDTAKTALARTLT